MSRRSGLSAVLREPMLHFLVAGLGLFLAYGLLSERSAETTPPGGVIEVTAAVQDRLATQFASTWSRPPTEEELAGLIEAHVREEVFYREAQALGLDRDDTVIRQRLKLKMDLLGEGAAGAMEPTEAELAAWYAGNGALLAPPGLAVFEQVLLAPGDDAVEVLALLSAGGDPMEVTAGAMLPTSVEASAPAVDGLFGRGFFDAVVALPPGEWAGPVPSGYGAHLVRLERSEAAPVPPLAEVRERAVELWRQDRAVALREAQYQELRARYDVRIATGGGE
jgi:hypothetical protein